jgi:hypothetical protein
MSKRAASIALVMVALTMLAQEPVKPRITSITVLPSEPNPAGNCTASTAGYLEEHGKTENFSDAELGHMIMSSLRDGYVLTIYPPARRGIFVFALCPTDSKRP